MRVRITTRQDTSITREYRDDLTVATALPAVVCDPVVPPIDEIRGVQLVDGEPELSDDAE